MYSAVQRTAGPAEPLTTQTVVVREESKGAHVHAHTPRFVANKNGMLYWPERFTTPKRDDAYMPLKSEHLSDWAYDEA